MRNSKYFLFALLYFPSATGAQEFIHEKQLAQVIKHAPITFKQMEEFDRNNPQLSKEVIRTDKYNAKRDTNINTPVKINQRIPGFPHIPPSGTYIERKKVELNRTLLQPGNSIEQNSALSGACVNYEMLEDNNMSYPPDVSSASGFDHTIITLNSQVRIKKKDGTTVSTVTLASFTSGSNMFDIFDPKIVFDHHSNRWIAIACCRRRSAASGFVIGITEDPDPSGTWQWYSVDGDANDDEWFDFPSLGFTHDKVVVTGNMFTNVGDTGKGGRLFVVNKSQLLAFETPTVTSFNNIHFTAVPATTFGNTGTCYVTAVHNGSLAQLYLYSVTGTGASPLLNNVGTVDYGAGNGWMWGLGNILPQKGDTVRLDGNDERMASCIYRNGKIWWANSFYWPLVNPNYAGVQYGIFSATTRVPIDFAGIWNNATEMFSYPNIMVNNDEDMGISFGYFTPNIYASAGFGYVNGALSLSNLTWNVSRYGDTTYRRGFGTPISYRWGDYFGIGLDPTDGKSMWLTGQYAAHRPFSTGMFGTYTMKLCATCTTNITTGVLHPTNYIKKYEATSTITATNETSSGALIKYDAGTTVLFLPGFRALPGSNVRAFIQGCGGSD